MLDHHIQRSIIYELSFSPSVSFSQLKPDDLDNKLFTYHLKKTISAGYVKKSPAGSYVLTPEGRRLSTGVLEKQQALVVERPLSVLFLIVRRKADGEWLLYERKTHPMIGYRGFMHARPNASATIQETARIELLRKTGLSGDFKALGGGYIRTFDGDELESYANFTLMACENAEGELVQNDKLASYSWELTPDFESPRMFPSAPILQQKYESGKPFFVEETFTI